VQKWRREEAGWTVNGAHKRGDKGEEREWKDARTRSDNLRRVLVPLLGMATQAALIGGEQ